MPRRLRSSCVLRAQSSNSFFCGILTPRMDSFKRNIWRRDAKCAPAHLMSGPSQVLRNRRTRGSSDESEICACWHKDQNVKCGGCPYHWGPGNLSKKKIPTGAATCRFQPPCDLNTFCQGIHAEIFACYSA